jgi:surface antigen
MSSVSTNKKYMFAAATLAAAVFGTVSANQTASADDTAASNGSWRAKSVDEVKAAVAEAGQSYTIQDGDTLSTIAEATDVSVDDLIAANGLSDENLIVAGENLTLQAGAAATVAATTSSESDDYSNASTSVSSTTASVSTASSVSYSHSDYSSQGNTYPVGQCTYYVKSVAPWVGNYWGNGGDWAGSAAAAGFRVDSTPEAGAVAVFAPSAQYTAYGHVAYVESVNGDGTITVSEGNYGGKAYNVRTLSAAGVQFIHR